MAFKMLLDLVPVHFSKLGESPYWLSLSSSHMPRLFVSLCSHLFCLKCPTSPISLFFCTIQCSVLLYYSVLRYLERSSIVPHTIMLWLSEINLVICLVFLICMLAEPYVLQLKLLKTVTLGKYSNIIK